MAPITCSALSGQDVRTNYMEWVLIEGGRYPDQIVDPESKQTADSQLAPDKGRYRKARPLRCCQPGEAVERLSDGRRPLAMQKLLEDFPPREK